MKSVVFAPGRVGPLPAYLGYLFLRFPGVLGPEESWDLECLDTYDRRWSRLGRVWVRRAGATFLVEPPCFFPLDDDPASAFGLQKPQLLGRVTVKVRPLEFTLGGGGLGGHVVKVHNRSYLVLGDQDDPRWAPLLAALVADGLEPVPPGTTAVPLVKDRGPGFPGPMVWSPPEPNTPGVPFLLDRLKDGLRMARQYERGIKDDVDTECLHQYRVHLRRVRSLASLGRMWELLPEWNRLKTLLRTLQQETNELRDLDVLLLSLPDLQSQLPWDEGPRLAGWGASLEKRRHAELRRVKAWLDSEEHRFLNGEVDRLLVDLEALGEPWTVGTLATSAFQRSARSLQKSLRNLGDDPADERLHEVRIEAKKLRYILDSLGGLGPREIVKTLAISLKETQEGLGRFQDRSILLGRLRTELEGLRRGDGADVLEPSDLLVLGMLIGVLVADQSTQKSRALYDCRKLGAKSFLKALGRLAETGETSHGA